ncbi:hemolysin E, partial [Klebsiella pneumoniae]|nr:hemolysin E [Klebsiella pneumoniae]
MIFTKIIRGFISAAYILLFDEYNEKKASAQKDILIKVLDDG